METLNKEEIISNYIKNLADAIGEAKKNKISEGIVNGIETVKQNLLELQNLVKKESDLKRLKLDVEKLIEDLLDGCKKGEERVVLGNMRQLRDKTGALKTILSR